MKCLSDYTKDLTTKLFEETNTIWAFSQKQFDENKIEGVQYVSIGSGGYTNKNHVDKLIKGLKEITKNGIAQDLKENGKEAIIKRELSNYECYYTYDLSDCYSNLKQYGITFQEIETVFNQTKHFAEL